jgi:hypothetical protein
MLVKLKKNAIAWYRLERWEKLAFFQLMAGLITVWPVLRFCSIKSVVTWVDNSFAAASKHVPPQNLTEADYVQRVVTLMQIAGLKSVYAATCLPQSVVLARYLRGRAIDVGLNIGVEKQDTSMRAHAWLSYRGCSLSAADSHYHAFALPRGLA